MWWSERFRRHAINRKSFWLILLLFRCGFVFFVQIIRWTPFNSIYCPVVDGDQSESWSISISPPHAREVLCDWNRSINNYKYFHGGKEGENVVKEIFREIEDDPLTIYNKLVIMRMMSLMWMMVWMVGMVYGRWWWWDIVMGMMMDVPSIMDLRFTP